MSKDKNEYNGKKCPDCGEEWSQGANGHDTDFCDNCGHERYEIKIRHWRQRALDAEAELRKHEKKKVV